MFLATDTIHGAGGGTRNGTPLSGSSNARGCCASTSPSIAPPAGGTISSMLANQTFSHSVLYREAMNAIDDHNKECDEVLHAACTTGTKLSTS